MLDGSLQLPAQLGIIGSLIFVIVIILVRQNRQVQDGKLIPLPTVQAERDAAKEKYDEMVILKDEQITALGTAKDEWRSAHGLSEEGRKEERDINAVNADTLKQLVRGTDNATHSGDNSPVTTGAKK